MTLGDRIRILAKRAGLTLNGLAREAGLDRSYLGRILSGETQNPGIRNMAALASALGVTLDALLEGVDGFDEGRLGPEGLARLLGFLARADGRTLEELELLLAEAEEEYRAPERSSRAALVPDDDAGDSPDHDSNNNSDA